MPSTAAAAAAAPLATQRKLTHSHVPLACLRGEASRRWWATGHDPQTLSRLGHDHTYGGGKKTVTFSNNYLVSKTVREVDTKCISKAHFVISQLSTNCQGHSLQGSLKIRHWSYGMLSLNPKT